MLELTYSVSYPLDPDTNTWLRDVDQEFLRVAERIHSDIPFALALIGEEASGSTNARDLTVSELGIGGFIVPAELWRRLAPPHETMNLSADLHFIPPTRETNIGFRPGDAI
jgi:hypothetical protein